jgi:hypothetical protein
MPKTRMSSGATCLSSHLRGCSCWTRTRTRARAARTAEDRRAPAAARRRHRSSSRARRWTRHPACRAGATGRRPAARQCTAAEVLSCDRGRACRTRSHDAGRRSAQHGCRHRAGDHQPVHKQHRRSSTEFGEIDEAGVRGRPCVRGRCTGHIRQGASYRDSSCQSRRRHLQYPHSSRLVMGSRDRLRSLAGARRSGACAKTWRSHVAASC